MRRLLMGLGLSLVIAGTVRADEQPGFVTLDRMDGTNRFGVQLGFDKIDAVDLSDGFGARMELYGQMRLESQPIGFYGQMPIGQLVAFDADDETALGNIEAGGYYLYQATPELELVLRGGLSLPTADDDFAGFLTNAFTGFERVTDLVAITPNTTWLRLSASPVWRRGNTFARADLGFEIPVISGDEDAEVNADVSDLFMHANGGVGVVAGPVAFMGELVTSGNLTGDGDLTDRFLHTLAASVATTGRNQLRASFVLPLDEDARGEIWILTVGFQAQL